MQPDEDQLAISRLLASTAGKSDAEVLAAMGDIKPLEDSGRILSEEEPEADFIKDHAGVHANDQLVEAPAETTETAETTPAAAEAETQAEAEPEIELLPETDPFAELRQQYEEAEKAKQEAFTKVDELRSGQEIQEFTPELANAEYEKNRISEEAQAAFVAVQEQSLNVVETNFPEFADPESTASLILQESLEANPDAYAENPLAVSEKCLKIAEQLKLTPAHQRQAQPQAAAPAKAQAQPEAPATVSQPVPPKTALPSGIQASHTTSTERPKGQPENNILTDLGSVKSEDDWEALVNKTLGSGRQSGRRIG